MVTKEVIRKYALKNAVEHDGKAVQGSILSSLFAEGLEKDKIKETMPLIQEVLTEVNSLSKEEQSKQFILVRDTLSHRDVRKEGELPELENAEDGKVVMRIAPYPSGPLHIGNTRQVILNDEYCKKYHGKYTLAMDDTIGNDAKPIEPEAYKLIEEGIRWLGCDIQKEIFYKSDRIEKYYEYGEEMIKKGYMYVCTCEQDAFKDYKDKGIECPCRNLPPSEQMKRWEKMLSKESKQGSLVVRLKTSMQDPDPAFRDRVMFKISDREHARVGKKYHVYPSMEFSWAIDDHVLGVTHIIRGIEHQMSTRVQDFIRGIFKWPNPVSIYTGHLILEGVKISKSKGAREVRSGEYTGWNDPRLWSLQSLRDRGIRPEAIREFIVSMGMTKSNSTVAIDVLYSINKKYLEKTPRYFFVEKPTKITIAGCPILEKSLPLHPQEKIGSRTYKTHNEFLISEQDLILMNNGNYRLMHLLNFKETRTASFKPQEFSFVSEDADKELKAKMIQWLPINPDNIKIKVRMPDGKIVEGIGEPALAELKEGAQVQFERFGFVKLYKKTKDELEFWFTQF
jgi:glutamyl-tRNA synthetase